ncbi:MAG: PAS domain-containing protein [Chloroflexi bacterium]|nr:PAS domain-containing protein [Chloroflexota bacterium]
MTQLLASPLTRLGARPPANPGGHFRGLAEQLDDAVLLVAPGTGLCQYANLKAAELTGYSRDELTHRSLAELVAVTDAPGALEQIYSALGGPARTLLNVPLRTRSGRIVAIDLRISTIAGGDGSRPEMLLFVRDAARRAAAEQIEARRALSVAAVDRLAASILNPEAVTLDRALVDYVSLLDADGAGLYLVTIDPPGIELRADVNLPSVFPKRLGAGDAQGCLTPLAWHTGQRPDTPFARAARAGGWSAFVAHPLSDGDASSGMVVAGFRSGRKAPDVAPMLGGVAARLVSALLLEQARSHLHRGTVGSAAALTQQLNTIFEAMSDGVFMLDADGVVARINAAGQELLGYRAEEVIGSRVEEVLVSPHSLDGALRAVLTDAQPLGEREAQLLRRDGHEFPARVQGLPLVDAQGRVSGAAVLFADVTHLKTLEAQGHHLEQQAYLGEMSAIFAHEIRNPLNTMATGLELIASRIPAEDSLQDTVNKILAEISRIDRLLRDILMVAKPAEVKIEPTDAHKFADRILTRFSPRLVRRNIEIARHYIPGTPPALMDSRMMEQVMVNLIENAVQAMGDTGGSLSVTVGPAARGGGREERQVAGDIQDYIQIDVGDTGPGIPAEVQKRIFDPFFTTKSDGTGLGLSIAKRIIHVHRGTLTMQTWSNVGTVFTILIPAARQIT